MNLLLSTIIVDDEALAVNNLKLLLQRYCPEISISGTAQNIAEAKEKLERLQPDVLFLDISMPEHNGFELLSTLNYIPFVIFVTAHDKYALRAMKLCAVDYILKPINPDELKNAVSKVKLLVSLNLNNELRKNMTEAVLQLNHHLSQKNVLNKICLPGKNGQGHLMIPTSTIVYLTGEDNYTIFNFKNGDKHIVSKTLKEYDNMLEHLGFIRVHKSHIINIHFLEKIIKNDGYQAIMNNGSSVPVSRRKRSELNDNLQKYFIDG